VANTWTDNYNRPTYEAEQLLYNHWLKLVQVEQPAEIINRFRTLFIHCDRYPDRTIVAALEKIAASKEVEPELKYILNRCCHIAINRWQTQPNKQAAIPELIAVFEEVPKVIFGYNQSRAIGHITKLVNQFTASEQYLTLKRLSKVITHNSEDSSKTPANQSLGTLIPRYPYLYSHCLLSDDSSYEQQTVIKTIQAQKQQQFEINLSQYVAHQVRKVQIARRGTSISFARTIQNIKNPTLLSDPELFFALKQFVGKVERGNTYRHIAGNFVANTSQTTQCYGSFKDDLYEYLISSITDQRYGQGQFKDKLYKQLQSTFPQNNSQQFNECLMMRTCSQLLNFLVVESQKRPNHFVFLDLISNLGPTETTGLLLKIVLICDKVKPYLEKRLAILFGHYEFSARTGVMWLVKALENLNLALSTNFGKVDVSFLR